MEELSAGLGFKFHRGDKVQQIEGGPTMVVAVLYTPTRVDEENRYGCKWFNTDIPREGTFAESQLKKV